MKRLAAVLACALLATACDGNSDPGTPAPGTTPQAEEPAPEPITLGSDAFEAATPLAHLPARADLAVATADPKQLAELLVLEPSAAEEGLRAGLPVLSDLHPTTLDSLGLDSTAPVGLVRYPALGGSDDTIKDTGRWAFWAKIGDRDKLGKTIAEPKPIESPSDNTVKKTAAPRTHAPDAPPVLAVWETEDGWAVIAPEHFQLARTEESKLATDDGFVKSRESLEYGGLATVWFTPNEGETAAIGLGVEGGKLGLRAVSSGDESATAAIAELPEHVGSTKLSGNRLFAILGAFGRSSEKAVALEKEIAAARRAPRLRQIEQLEAAVAERAVEHVDAENAHAELVPKEALAAIYSAWAEAAMTDEEAAEIAKMEKKLKKLESEAMSALFGGALESKGLLGGMKSTQSTKDIFGDMKGMDIGKVEGFGSGGLGSKGFGSGGAGAAGLGSLGSRKGGGGTGYGTIGSFGTGKSKRVKVVSADPDLKGFASRKLSRVKRCYDSGAPQSPFRVSARVTTDHVGKVSVTSVNGANSAVHDCVKQALGGMAAEKNVDGSLSFEFVEK